MTLTAQEIEALEEADALLEEALESLGSKQEDSELAETLLYTAVATSPLLSEGYAALADLFAVGPAERLQLWRSALSAAEIVLGEDFEAYRGDFWLVLETRPYMRAKEGLADCLLEIGRVDEALRHYSEMLELNPNDNQGVRDILVDQLVRLKRDDAAAALIARYPDDWTAPMLWSAALLAFRQHGSSDAADKAFATAHRRNGHVGGLLTGKRPLPKRQPEYFSVGDKDEAVIYAGYGKFTWSQFPDAIVWLKGKLGK